MSLNIGQVLRGRAAFYHVTKVVKTPTVFQAKVVPFEAPELTELPTQLAMIKTFPRGKPMDQYNRERRTYALPSISQSPYIRGLLDIIGHDADDSQNESSQPDFTSQKDVLNQAQENQPQCMVFEWMDTDLWQLPSQPFRSGSPLPRIVARSVLEALVVFDNEDGVHADVNPNNIFVSSAGGPSPLVKLGDLGVAVGSGPMKIRYQGLHIRAPEVWKNIGITPKADIWSLGVTLAHWMASTVIFGPSGKTIEGETEAFCIAKMMRLMGPLGEPDQANQDIVDEFHVAQFLEQSTFIRPETGKEEQYVKARSIRQELEAISGIEKGCIDFILSLLVVDHTKRPSAMEALRHPWLQETTIEDELD
ncbi:hypothetical protein ONS95_001625 [Cadophora gregata]|uniref:uncharacterized protein n=1 Tax=Cadophora gregata TaxID=51156 RepID=UPI0026DD90C7|nr:uncharacterized protein ONS95_001625 [Cadophora gregata]KAK0111253.1 hypothetical protein ONS95_001625 [Cadophora gregata]KAK0112276.1 hypothetical protein ONS96_001524 [Cadophora gregata f. sp. sojae]